ncbi:MAG: polyprenyl synthetase family protein [Actinophytocola sp.]|nr:polyprenyl synthetase family protein [Actinophytocola sp.]
MTTANEMRSAASVLSWASSTVEPVLRKAVDSLPGPLRHMSGYQLGWWDSDGVATRASGKAVRPALTLLCAQASRGGADDAVTAAAAVELAHNHSLVHDDVMDGDAMRRHRPTVWRAFGAGPAIMAGDALLTLAFDLLASSGAETATLRDAIKDLLRGQCADLDFEHRDDVTLAEVHAMSRDKTAALFGAACALGAQAAGSDGARLEHLRGFGMSLGVAFQLVDDLLGIWGDPEVTGKPVYEDLRRRKKSLPVVAALTSGTDAGRELAERYARDRADLADLAELIDRACGRVWAHEQADLALRNAVRDLWLAEPSPGPATELAALARLIVERDR